MPIYQFIIRNFNCYIILTRKPIRIICKCAAISVQCLEIRKSSRKLSLDMKLEMEVKSASSSKIFSMQVTSNIENDHWAFLLKTREELSERNYFKSHYWCTEQNKIQEISLQLSFILIALDKLSTFTKKISGVFHSSVDWRAENNWYETIFNNFLMNSSAVKIFDEKILWGFEESEESSLVYYSLNKGTRDRSGLSAILIGHAN